MTKVELYDNYDTLQKGETVTIMGYPGASPRVYGVIQSKDVFNQGTRSNYSDPPSRREHRNIIRDSDETIKIARQRDG